MFSHGFVQSATRDAEYLRKGVPLDPWGRAYVYRSPGEVNPESYDLLSYGRDGAVGGQGEDADVTSWGGAIADGRSPTAAGGP